VQRIAINGPVLVALFVSLFILPGCSLLSNDVQISNASPANTSSANKSLDGHLRMVALLEQLRMDGDNTHQYLGDGNLRRLLANRAVAEKQGKTIPLPYRFSKALLLRNLGRTEDAIDELLILHELLKKSGLPQSVEVGYELAVTFMRGAEIQNCVDNHTGESCLLPIRGSGVHINKEYARQAMRYAEETLIAEPDNIPALWLLNVAAMAIGEYPEVLPEPYRIAPESFESQEPFPKFPNISMMTGLNTMSQSGGSIADDLNGDGLLDIVASSWGPGDQLRVYMNSGDGTFHETTEQAGIIGIYGGLNLNQADFDNDGDIDIYVMRGAWLGDAGRHPNSLLRNDGNGYFVDVTFDAGLGEAQYPTQAAGWADYDNDGHIDLFVGSEQSPCQLYRNNGDGTFTDRATEAGLQADRFTKGIMWGDYDNDRFPDLYLSNLAGPNQLFHNQGDGTFIDRAPDVGVTLPEQSFPGWFWDFNNDGALDLFVGAYSSSIRSVALSFLGRPHLSPLDRLYQGDGHGGFRDVTEEQNLTGPSLPMGANFGDLDNDGFPDFYLGTGDPNFDSIMPNLMFHNLGGTGFANVSTAGGFGHLQKGHGVSFADLDNDGDQDVFMEMGGAFLGDAYMNALFENPGFSNNWITIKLIGDTSNRSAVGARIRCSISEGGTKRDIYKWVNSGGSFGANPLRREIGLGQAETIDVLDIYWPTSDTTQRFEDVAVNQFLEITEGQETYRPMPQQQLSLKSSM
jgi:hypothetical protein